MAVDTLSQATVKLIADQVIKLVFVFVLFLVFVFVRFLVFVFVFVLVFVSQTNCRSGDYSHQQIMRDWQWPMQNRKHTGLDNQSIFYLSIGGDHGPFQHSKRFQGAEHQGQGSHHVHTHSTEAGKAGSGGSDGICDGDGKNSMPNTSYELQHTVSQTKNRWFRW